VNWFLGRVFRIPQGSAEDLERAHDVEANTALNLPPYDQLIAD
jgi:hypothetical protein